jgi:HEAT repeat protein
MQRMPGDTRRHVAISLKRILTPPVIDGLVEQAYRLTEEQARTAEVLNGAGVVAAERVLDMLQHGGAFGPRAFLLEAVAGVRDLFPNLARMARSPNGSDAWLAAELLGRIDLPEAVTILSALVKHPEERVRLAAIEGLGHYSEKGVVEALRVGLTHDAPATRARAGRVLAARGSRAIAMPLVAALEAEKHPGAWEELVGAIASLGTPEGPGALARMILEPGGSLGPRGGVRRQLAVVRALAAAPGPSARQALEAIAAGGQGDAQELARSLLAGG